MAVLSRVGIDRSRIRADRPWYLDVPAIAHVAAHGLDLDAGVTVIVGENGSGKSTFIEAVAFAWRRRLTSAAEMWGPEPSEEDADLYWAVTLDADRPLSHGGCFLRAEAMHSLFSIADSDSTVDRQFGGRLNTRSHGESFLAFLQSRLTERGLFILDEPEAALSFTSCLQLLVLLDAITRAGSQVLLATHSPILAAAPGATVLEFGPSGLDPVRWDDLELVAHWRAFLEHPDAYLRHLRDD